MKSIINQTASVLTAIGRVQSTLIMGLVYFLIIGPMAIIYQISRRKEKNKKSCWIRRKIPRNLNQYLENQY